MEVEREMDGGRKIFCSGRLTAAIREREIQICDYGCWKPKTKQQNRTKNTAVSSNQAVDGDHQLTPSRNEGEEGSNFYNTANVLHEDPEVEAQESTQKDASWPR